MTTRPHLDLLSVRGQTDVGSREWIQRTGRGFRAAWHGVAEADRVVGDQRVDHRLHNPF